MKKTNILILLLVAGSLAYGKEYHVSVKGNDANQGTVYDKSLLMHFVFMRKFFFYRFEGAGARHLKAIQKSRQSNVFFHFLGINLFLSGYLSEECSIRLNLHF
jgi:hypothetical protein